MEISKKSCRICLTESEFNVSLFGSYCRRTTMVDKILVCLKLVIEETDYLDTICYKCTENIERYYNFIMFVKKSQTRMVEPRPNVEINRKVTSYVREQVYDADYTFSFLELPEKKEIKSSSPFFSYYSPPMKEEHVWKPPMNLEKDDELKRRSKKTRHNSRDLFESQSQDDEVRTVDWKLSPNNILKRVRDKCFGRSDF